MDHRNTQMKVGVFIFLGVIFLVLAIFFLGGRNQLFKREYHLKTQFSDISGLRVGAQVQLAGLPIGMVDQIRFADELQEKRVIVFLSLDKAYQDRIRENSFAMVNTQGLLGDKVVSISPGSPDKNELQDGDWLQTTEQPSLLSMLGEGGDAVKIFQKPQRSWSIFWERFKKVTVSCMD
ncbi:MAG: MCE family protein [Deltaproteobacteria bacterium]|nr:MAG: MCE family protein [Deltaproteobacteria bacterium]